MPEGKGFADIVLIPRRNVNGPAVVLEMKYDKSAKTAIQQIKEKRYAEALNEYFGEVVLVGINYDKVSKQYECIIERTNIDSSQLSEIPINSTSCHQVIAKYSLSIRQVVLLLEKLKESMSAKQMRDLVGRKDATYFRQSTIQPLMEDKIIAPTDANSIHSPKQKYYLLEKGMELLKQLEKDISYR